MTSSASNLMRRGRGRVEHAWWGVETEQLCGWCRLHY